MNIVERAKNAWNEKADGFNQWHELDIEEKLRLIGDAIKELGPEFRADKRDFALEGDEGFEQFIDILRGTESTVTVISEDFKEI
jgi:hypothetical protein